MEVWVRGQHDFSREPGTAGGGDLILVVWAHVRGHRDGSVVGQDKTVCQVGDTGWYLGAVRTEIVVKWVYWELYPIDSAQDPPGTKAFQRCAHLAPEERSISNQPPRQRTLFLLSLRYQIILMIISGMRHPGLHHPSNFLPMPRLRALICTVAVIPNV